MGKPGTPMQDRAVLREFYDACDSGATHLAADIVRANPDLFERFTTVLGTLVVPRDGKLAREVLGLPPKAQS